MSSALEASAARAKQAAEAEARELNKLRESQRRGDVHAGPSLKPPTGSTAATTTTDVDQPPAKARKLNDVLDGVEEEAKSDDNQKNVDGPDESLMNRPKWYSKIKSAAWWYYQDTLKSPQGPFYPGQMRDWFSAG